MNREPDGYGKQDSTNAHTREVLAIAEKRYHHFLWRRLNAALTIMDLVMINSTQCQLRLCAFASKSNTASMHYIHQNQLYRTLSEILLHHHVHNCDSWFGCKNFLLARLEHKRHGSSTGARYKSISMIHPSMQKWRPYCIMHQTIVIGCVTSFAPVSISWG